MLQLVTTESKCNACGSVFAAPVASDFDYGGSVFTGIHGTVYAYHNAVGCEAWDFVTSVYPDPDGKNQGELIARIADSIDGQALTSKFVCPKCYSDDWAYWCGKRIGSVDGFIATFEKFLALESDQREYRVRQIFDELSQ